MKKRIIILLFLFCVGLAVGLLLRLVLGKAVPESLGYVLGMIVTIPTIILLLAFLPIGYILGRKMPDDI